VAWDLFCFDNFLSFFYATSTILISVVSHHTGACTRMADRLLTTDDVKTLHEQFNPQPGDLIPWEALEEILSPLTRRDRRFATIYLAWIRYLRRWHNRKMVVVRGQGLRVLRERDRSGDVCQTLGRTWTIFERAKTDVDDIQIVELSQRELDETHHVRHVTHMLHRIAAEQRARLASYPRMPEGTPSGPAHLVPG
jgi:hypothetical protein